MSIINEDMSNEGLSVTSFTFSCMAAGNTWELGIILETLQE